MKCHILFSEKNKKNISKCRLLKILPSMLSIRDCHFYNDFLKFTMSKVMTKPVLGHYRIYIKY